MKRKILKKFGINEKKCALCLMLTGFAALNTGFISEVDAIKNTEVPAAIEETGNTPQVPATVVVENAGEVKPAEGTENGAVEENAETVSNVEIVEERPRENMIETSRGMVRYTDVIDMEATAYLPTDGSPTGTTAIGIPATYGIVAVDPRVIPLGTRVYIPGYGEALAADTGGAIKGYKIDLCMESYSQAMRFGRRGVTVYILE